MGNFSSILWPSYTALSEQRIEQTELQYYIDLASALLKSRIVHVSNEFFGDAANLLKPEKCKTLKDIGQDPVVDEQKQETFSYSPYILDIADGERDGWQTQRHIDSASQVYTMRIYGFKCYQTELGLLSLDRVTIRFGIHGLIRGFDIDTTSFDDACPVSVTIEAARSMRKGEQSQVCTSYFTFPHACVTHDHTTLTYIRVKWDIVLPNVKIQPNRHNLYTINDNQNVYSEVRVTMPSSGGIVSNPSLKAGCSLI